VHIEGTHEIAAVFPTKYFNTRGWPYWPKHVVFFKNFLRTFKTFGSLHILNVNVFAHKTEKIFTDCNWEHFDVMTVAYSCFMVKFFLKFVCWYIEIYYNKCEYGITEPFKIQSFGNLKFPKLTASSYTQHLCSISPRCGKKVRSCLSSEHTYVYIYTYSFKAEICLYKLHNKIDALHGIEVPALKFNHS
jgi:hypothetical protein